jgi:hypothetical protein
MMNRVFLDEERPEKLGFCKKTHPSRPGIDNCNFDAWLFSADFQEFEECSRPPASWYHFPSYFKEGPRKV